MNITTDSIKDIVGSIQIDHQCLKVVVLGNFSYTQVGTESATKD